jgi:hypothetical protein
MGVPRGRGVTTRRGMSALQVSPAREWRINSSSHLRGDNGHSGTYMLCGRNLRVGRPLEHRGAGPGTSRGRVSEQPPARPWCSSVALVQLHVRARTAACTGRLGEGADRFGCVRGLLTTSGYGGGGREGPRARTGSARARVSPRRIAPSVVRCALRVARSACALSASRRRRGLTASASMSTCAGHRRCPCLCRAPTAKAARRNRGYVTGTGCPE